MTDRAWNGVGIAAVVVAGLMLVYYLLTPVQAKGKAVQTKANEERKLTSDINRIRDDITRLRTENEARLWTQAPDQVAASAMARVTTLAASKGLKVIAFRPQRAVEDGSVTRYPYLVSLEGAYPNVVAFVNLMETPSGKLCVNQVQIAASDGASDKVSASVGLVAYRELEVAKK